MKGSARIPAITDPLGKHWRQPDRDAITFDRGRAIMTRETFDALPDYSGSIPSGVYDGKMWKRLDGLYDPTCAPEDRKWMLCWYYPGTKPTQCRIDYVPITIRLVNNA